MLIKASDRAPLPEADYPTIPNAPFHGNVDTPVLLPADIAKRLIDASGKPKRHGNLEVLQSIQVGRNGSDDTAVCSATDLQVPVSVSITPDPGKRFPEYSRVMPKPDRPAISIVLGVPVLETLIKSAKAIGATTVRVDLPTETTYHEKGTTIVSNAIQVTYKSGDIECTAVLMPCRA
jgi:hypothetical protein